MITSDQERIALIEAFTKVEDGMDVFGDGPIDTVAGPFVHVGSQRGDKHRWYDEVEEIYKSPCGRLFACPWERGLTENQEHEYRIEDTFEVEAYEVTVTEYRKKKA